MCEETGCAGSSCLPNCHELNVTITEDGILDKLGSLPVYQRWKQWICSTECHYHCLLSKETEEAGLEQTAIGYRANWCLARVMVNEESSSHLYSQLAKSVFSSGLNLGLINEHASAVFSAVNLLVNLLGILTFVKLVHHSLPSRPISGGPYYPFAGLWTIYGILSTVYWVAQCIFHLRNIAIDKHIDSSLEVVLVGYAFILAIVRIANIRSEQGRVVVLAPMLAFLCPHLMYINLCNYDYGLNIQVCLMLGTIQYLLWIIWAGVTKHPARYQLWLLAVVAPLTLYLRMYDFSYLWDVLDTQALWTASAIPSTFLWWSFARCDAEYQTKVILRKRDTQVIDNIDPKKVQ